jgi:hypothetical protein
VGKAKRDHEQAAPPVIGVEILGRLPWHAVKHQNQAATGDKIQHKQKIEPGRCDSRRRTTVPHWRTDRTASSCGNEELGGKIKAWR